MFPADGSNISNACKCIMQLAKTFLLENGDTKSRQPTGAGQVGKKTNKLAREFWILFPLIHCFRDVFRVVSAAIARFSVKTCA